MKILVLNAGSSSLKYQLVEMPKKTVQCSGIVERIGFDDAIFTHRKKEQKFEVSSAIQDHNKALKLVIEALTDVEKGVLNSIEEIKAVGHRVVHGGQKFSNPTIVSDEVKKQIRELSSLAPLHNPANLIGIEVAQKLIPKAKQVAIFDTAFHQTMPKEAYKYAIPEYFLKDKKIRAYGFHGTSHKYVSEKAREYLGLNNSQKLISIHLGNGCSMSAIRDGKSIENSLGLGPMNGLVMGTRSGDIDQSVLIYMQNHLGMSVDEVNTTLQKESGLKALTGFSDVREITEKARSGDRRCIDALHLVTYRIKKYIGAYTAILNGINAIIFTAGIGENSALIRSLVCKELEYLGVSLNKSKNEIFSKGLREIQSNESTVKIVVVPTNEEIEIAKQAYALVNN